MPLDRFQALKTIYNMKSNSVYDLFKVCIRFLMVIFIDFTTIVRIIDVYMYVLVNIYNSCI